MGLSQKAANHLKAIRQHNKLNIEQFAEMIGMKRQQVSRWENGRANLSMKSFDEICGKLGLNPESFICGSPEIDLPKPL